MFKRSRPEVPRRERGGLVSHVLLDAAGVTGSGWTVTWVEVSLRARRSARTLTRRSRSTSWFRGVACYVSAATPNVNWQAFYDAGPPSKRSEEKERAER